MDDGSCETNTAWLNQGSDLSASYKKATNNDGVPVPGAFTLTVPKSGPYSDLVYCVMCTSGDKTVWSNPFRY